jgi:hypothetical protein
MPIDPPQTVPDPDSEDERLDEGLEESFPASDPPSQARPHPSEDKTP